MKTAARSVQPEDATGSIAVHDKERALHCTPAGREAGLRE